MTGSRTLMVQLHADAFGALFDEGVAGGFDES